MNANKYLSGKTERKERKVLFVRCNDELRQKIVEEAKQKGVNQSQLVLAAVEYFLDKLQKERKKKTA